MDVVSSQTRSRMMGAVRATNTKPELVVRRLAHKLGYRFRLHRRDLPGTPDLLFPKYNICLFVHGCFWHRHQGCKAASNPSSNVDFWKDKFDRNVTRDARNEKALRNAGWRVFVIWECETKKAELLNARFQELFAQSLAVPDINVRSGARMLGP